eukprot:1147022-Pelagomonas_calceolata.AAC.5
MDDLVAMPSVTLPMTLVCCGNRRVPEMYSFILMTDELLAMLPATPGPDDSGVLRKEENMLKKTIGFNWGPGAVSTSYWTGVRLCDMLKHVGAK